MKILVTRFKIANMVYDLLTELSIFTGNASYLWYYRSPWNKFLMTPSTELPRCNLEKKNQRAHICVLAKRYQRIM